MVSLIISQNNEQILQKASIIKPGVEFLGIINKQGRMLNFIGVPPHWASENKKEMFYMKIALRRSMQSDFDDELGEVKYCITVRNSKKYISIPTLNSLTILAITKSDYDHEEFVADIIQTLKHSNEFLGEKIPKRDEFPIE